MKQVSDFDANMQASKAEAKNIRWRSIKDEVFGLYGSDALQEPGFYRLTRKERELIGQKNEGKVWLAGHASGIQVRFATDSAQVFVRAVLGSRFDMTNMTQIGQCGADLYVFDEAMGEYVLHEVVRYAFDGLSYELPLGHFQNAPGKVRKYLLYLPLYITVEEFELGLEEDAVVTPVGFASPKRIGVYGTSIVQGCSASRPGMSPTNILSRRLDAEVLNFGFSGCAFMEKEMAEILGRRKLDVLIVDTEPNAGVDGRLEQNAAEFFDTFFRYQPETPVLVFSRVLFAIDTYDEYRVSLRERYKKFLRKTAETYRKRGHRMYFADGSKIFKGNFTEYTADGIHPSDMGMCLIADAYGKELKKRSLES